MKLLAVSACVAGVAHTYMAAEAIEKAAREKGHEIKVETQGASGIENRITDEDVKAADAVILTNDMPIRDKDRFKGKRIFNIASNDLIRFGDKVIDIVEKAVNEK